MTVTMSADALHGGANEFARTADVLLGHARSVAGLAGLRAAFAGAGETVWPAVEARLTDLVGRLEHAHARTARAGALLRTAADGSTAIDQRNGNAIRM
jgi:hypothetical protein